MNVAKPATTNVPPVTNPEPPASPTLKPTAPPVAPKGLAGDLLDIPERGLQKVFDKHGKDFGMTGNWRPARNAELLDAIKAHVNAAGAKAIKGTYRGKDVLHHVDPTTGLNVITDLNGKFIGGWKLGVEQLESVLASGRLF